MKELFEIEIIMAQNSKKALEKLEKSPQWENKRQRNGETEVLKEIQARGQGPQTEEVHLLLCTVDNTVHTRHGPAEFTQGKTQVTIKGAGSGHINCHLDAESQLNSIFPTLQENDF